MTVFHDYYHFLLWLPPAAVALDLLLGDPAGWPHPVRALGFVIRRAGRWVLRRQRKFAAGLLMVALLYAGALGLGLGAAALPGALFVPLALYFAYAGLALGSLLRAGAEAARLLEADDLEEGRRAVSYLVSRQVAHLDKPGLARALAESLSENFNDGFVAPFFWLLAGGLPGLWVYKTASTLDSMWGYKNDTWRAAGRAAARVDDALAFIPARLAALFLRLGARLLGLPLSRAEFALARRQARRMESPNAGLPMAAAAWAHRASMGGPAVYDGQPKDKPRLGPEVGEWDNAKLRALLRHLRLSGLAGGALLWLVALAIWIALR